MSDKEYIGVFEFRRLFRAFKSIYDVAETVEYAITDIEEANEYCGTGGSMLIKGMCMNGLSALTYIMQAYIESLPDNFDKTQLTELHENFCSEVEVL
jgi:hypothetical protein